MTHSPEDTASLLDPDAEDSDEPHVPFGFTELETGEVVPFTTTIRREFALSFVVIIVLTVAALVFFEVILN